MRAAAGTTARGRGAPSGWVGSAERHLCALVIHANDSSRTYDNALGAISATTP